MMKCLSCDEECHCLDADEMIKNMLLKTSSKLPNSISDGEITLEDVQFVLSLRNIAVIKERKL